MRKEKSSECERTEQIFLWCQAYVKHLDRGHVGIQMENDFYNFGFAGDEYSGPEIGEMRKETASKVAENYYKRHTKKCMLRMQKGKKAADPNPSLRPMYVYSICISESDLALLREKYEEMHRNPPVYHIAEINCVTTTIDSLEDLNLYISITRRNQINSLCKWIKN